MADSYDSWPEWTANTEYAKGDKVKVTETVDNETVVTGYVCKTANNDAEFTAAKWTKDGKYNYVEVIGNGESSSARSNAYALGWDGTGHYAGDVCVHANNDSSGGVKLVSETDYATQTVGGVVKVNNTGASGLAMQNGELKLFLAQGTEIKSGTNNFKPIVPSKQHEATFYGLAKAAGDSTQSASDNAVGTYTDGAKTAIQNMLGVPSKSYVDTAISNINTMQIHICTEQEYDAQTGIPTIQEPDGSTFYLVPGSAAPNLYVEWVYVDGAWEQFGQATIDLSGYATKADTVLDTTLSRGRMDGTNVGSASFAFGSGVEASAQNSHAEGFRTIASGHESHAEGYETTASGSQAHVEGYEAIASGIGSHAEGYQTKAEESASHAEGYKTTASGMRSHAEGNMTVASGSLSHAEGHNTQSTGTASHAEGNNTIAVAQSSHAGGAFNVEDSFSSWPEWATSTSYVVGDKVKVTTTVNNETTVTGYICKTANSDAEFTAAKWNVDTKYNYAEIIGNGTAVNARSNARALSWEGDEHLMGDVYVGCNADSTGGTKLPRDVQVNGASVVTDGVANVPIATAQNLGVVKISNGSAIGVDIPTGGVLKLLAPSKSMIKAGASLENVAVISQQHIATFYGLSKVAGVDLANETVTLGTYPVSSQTAIKSMLGVQEGLRVVRLI